jgi:hypothetical protein
MNAAQAKKISLYNLLSHLGYQPKETRHGGNEVWYQSPFRNEKDASFKIKVDQNIWYDFGEGAGGNVLDFVMKFKRCDLKQALLFLEHTPLKGNLGGFISLPKFKEPAPDLFESGKTEVLEVKPVYHFALKEYLKQRCIAPTIAFSYLREIKYRAGDKEYFALGFANRAGGWEVRSAIFKGCIGKKDISAIETGAKSVNVFEGYMDFLSCLTLSGRDKMEGDVIVLNSVSLKRKAVGFVKANGYDLMDTYLDNDKGGVDALNTFREELPSVIIKPQNNLYGPFNDFNDYLMNKGKQQIG